MMLEVGEGFGVARLGVFPVCTDEGGAGHIEVVTVGGRRQTTPDEVGEVALLTGANRQRGVAAKVGLQHCIEDVVVFAFGIAEGAGVLPRRNNASAQRAAFVQRPADVGTHPVVVPAAGRGPELSLPFGGGALAHQIDRGGGVAGALNESGRAAHHLHPIEDGEVGLRTGDIAVHGGWHTIVHHRVYRETT